ncbi:MAG TPA: hypothetical protein VMF09_04585 [Solirubrobacteraceae bacterium]|nr:hypothetical protein [Solirubrobacteraceae bacterium]
MTTVREVALPLATICTPVPRVAEQVEGQVSQPCPLIVPISLYEVGFQLHYQLKHYKDGNGSQMARDFLVKTAALLGYFLQKHDRCIAIAAAGGGGGWDLITSVPSSTDRTGEHPLATAIGLVPSLRDRYERQSRLVFDFDVCCVGDHR